MLSKAITENEELPKLQQKLQKLIAKLREADISEEIIKLLELEFNQNDPDFDYSCISCGRFSSSILCIESNGELLYSAPDHMVYCYRNDKPHGLCKECFVAGCLEGFSESEVDYFREMFS